MGKVAMGERRKIAVIGLGYVGLPVAVAFARKGFDVVGFEIDNTRIEELQRGEDRTREVSPADLKTKSLKITGDAEALRSADFFIVTVPTPIDDALAPDLGAVKSASRTVGRVLKRGDIVVYESTVYPGCTEEDCAPILEAESGLKSGADFTLGYSPERINPGDVKHRFETILKVVSGQDARTLDIIAETYGAVVDAGVHRAPSIRVAEAAKVIENTQRDLNIALMNELSLILNRMNIDTGDVLAAAGTKWNFLGFTPGLVGGHCIGVDPYYLTHKAQRIGYHPQVVLAGRRVNDGMGRHIARECIRLLTRLGRARPLVTVLGVTFKEDVPDVRNSKAIDIVDELKEFGIDVQVVDPNADPAAMAHEYNIKLNAMNDVVPADAVVVAVAHHELREGGWPLIQRLLRSTDGGVVLDVKGFLDRDRVPAGLTLWRM
jgi:UDP-N-acetyl-D-glucosamine/UDP-N-acetyl-D-galactosamine dehydrogenase